MTKETFFSCLKNEVLSGPKDSLLLYWKSYGGFFALVRSVYLYVALFLSFLVVFFGDIGEPWDWDGVARSVIPNILGFSLGGYGMLVGFGDEGFLKAIRGKGGDGSCSPYMVVNGAFVHFIVIQVVALFFAIVAEAVKIDAYNVILFFGSFLLFYALTSILSTALAILNLADWFDEGKDIEED